MKHKKVILSINLFLFTFFCSDTELLLYTYYMVHRMDILVVGHMQKEQIGSFMSYICNVHMCIIIIYML